MQLPEHYCSDLLFFFDGRPEELALYEALWRRMEAAFPDAAVRVQKTQISFYDSRLFAAVSLPMGRRRGWPAHCVLVTMGLGRRLDVPRVAAAVEPSPGRWTNHVPVSAAAEIDEELLGWLQEARDFARTKKRRRR